MDINNNNRPNVNISARQKQYTFTTYNTLQRYRYGMLNLAVQAFGFSESMPAKLTKIGNDYYSVWTATDLKPTTTLGEVIDRYTGVNYVKKINGRDINMALEPDFISGDSEMIYTRMMMLDSENVNSIKNKTMLQAIRDLTKTSEVSGDYFFTISLDKMEEDSDDSDSDEIENNVDNMNNMNNDELMITCRVSL